MAREVLVTIGSAVLLGLTTATCAPAAPDFPPVEEVPTLVDVTQTPEPLSVAETILYANQQYASALEEVDAGLLLDSWHGEARRRWEQAVQRLADANRYRLSESQIEVTTVYFSSERTAIAKTIESWDFEERDRTSDEVRSSGALGPLHETYYLETVNGGWSIRRFEISGEPSLTLTDIQGQVFVNAEQVQEDREVFEGDEIATALGSSAILLYPFDGTTEMRQDGHIRLNRVRVDPDRAATVRGSVEIELFSASLTDLWNRLTKTVRVIFTALGRRAADDPAEFGVTLRDDGTFIVAVEEGEVELTSAGVSITLRGGEQSFALPGLPPVPPLPWPGPPLVPGTDLVILAIELTGAPEIGADGMVEVPLRVIARNLGDTEAEVFKLHVDYTGPAGTFVAPFSVPGETSAFYPFARGALAPGTDMSFEGIVRLPGELAGETISLTAVADSCAGEEFMPAFCRVEENEEGNNEATLQQELPEADLGGILGTVWVDENFDGVGESPYVGARVLLGQGACPVARFRSTATDAKGAFTFNDLLPGPYCVTIDIKQQCDVASAPTTPKERTLLVASGRLANAGTFAFAVPIC